MQPNRRPIPLFPNPPDSPRRSQHESEIESDFPACCVIDSTPDPPTPPANLRCRSSHRHHSPVVDYPARHSLPGQSHQLPRRRVPKREFRDKNVVNTIKVTVQRDAAPKLSVKRGSENKDYATDAPTGKRSFKRASENDIIRPAKRQHIDDDDITVWLTQEMDEIKERLVQIADHQAGVDVKLEEIMRQVQEFNEI